MDTTCGRTMSVAMDLSFRLAIVAAVLTLDALALFRFNKMKQFDYRIEETLQELLGGVTTKQEFEKRRKAERDYFIQMGGIA